MEYLTSYLLFCCLPPFTFDEQHHWVAHPALGRGPYAAHRWARCAILAQTPRRRWRSWLSRYNCDRHTGVMDRMLSVESFHSLFYLTFVKKLLCHYNSLTTGNIVQYTAQL